MTRSLDRSPVYQAAFTYDNTGGDEELTLTGLVLEEVSADIVSAAKHDLHLFMGPDKDGSLEGSFVYDADLFAASSVGGWVDAFTLLIEGLVSDSAAPVLTLPILNEEGQQQVITSSSGPVVEHDASLLTLPCPVSYTHLTLPTKCSV